MLRAAFAGLGTKYPIAACRKLIAAEQEAPSDAPAATHAGYAKALLAEMKQTHGGVDAVGVAGGLYTPDEKGIWRDLPVGELAVAVADRFDGMERCERRSDYQSIALHAYDIAARGNEDFFEDAPVGLACDGKFYRLNVDGSLKVEPLRHSHRQRFEAPAAPLVGPTPIFNTFLHETFKHDDPTETHEQIALVQEVLGAVALGLMARHEKVVLAKGPGRAGKGTMLRVIEHLVPREFRTASSPFRWDQEYFLADLAGKRLNVVGELPEDKPIPSSHFKSVIGRDLLTGRHPTHRPFTFRNEAAHVFNSNHFVYTVDRSEAFFTRWLLIDFKNSRIGNEASIDTGLAASMLESELPAIIAWSLDGAQRLQRRGHFQVTRAHRRMMDQWRVRTDPVMEFISDPDACIVESMEPGALLTAPWERFEVKRSILYSVYEKWCRDSNRKPLGKQKFHDEIESPAVASMGIRVRRDGVLREVVHGVHVCYLTGRPASLEALDLFV